MDTEINVCYALNDISGNYAKFLGVSLCSLLENTKNRVTAHILHDDTLTEENKNRLIVLVKHYGQKISFYNILEVPIVKEFLAKLQQLYMPRYHGMFYRFAIGAVLPSYIEKVIYLDADTIVHIDIAKIWNTSFEGQPIAAVSDSIIAMLPYDMAPSLVKKGVVRQDKYFNSGVLLMDMKYFREYRQIMNDVLHFVQREGINKEYPDQDFLNCAFDKLCRLLPVEYNLLVNYARMKNIYKEEAIIHYAGGALRLDTHDAFDTLFWHYLCKTPWQNENASMRSLSDLAQNCRELSEKVNVLKLLLIKNKRLILGSRALVSALESSISGTFYDSGEDETTNLTCGDIFDVFFSLPPADRVIVVLSNYYDTLKRLFISMGLEEGSDFVDGYVLTLSEKEVADFKDSSIIGRY